MQESYIRDLLASLMAAAVMSSLLFSWWATVKASQAQAGLQSFKLSVRYLQQAIRRVGTCGEAQAMKINENMCMWGYGRVPCG